MPEKIVFTFLSPDGNKLFYFENGSVWTRKLHMITLENSEIKKIPLAGTGFQDAHMSPSGKYIAYMAYFGQDMAEYIYHVEDEKNVEIVTEYTDAEYVQDFTFAFNHWSPTNDFLWGITSIYKVDEEKIIPKLGDYCNSIKWTPDGKHLFLYNCGGPIGAVYHREYLDTFTPSGIELVNIEDGTKVEYPSAGLCDSAISPDSKWVLFYYCTDEAGNVTGTSQVLNLETKEMTPIFQNIKTNNLGSSSNSRRTLWSVIWVP